MKITIEGKVYNAVASDNPQPTDKTMVIDGVTYTLTEVVAGTIEKIQVNGQVYDIKDVEDVAAEAERAKEAEYHLGAAIAAEAERAKATEQGLQKTFSKAIGIERFGVSNHENNVNIHFAPVDSTGMRSVTIPAATTEKAGVMSANDKTKVDTGFVGTTKTSEPIELNTYTQEGVFNFINVTLDNGSPISGNGVVSGKLTVLITNDNDNKVITQVLNINNNEGGEGNIYIRSQQNGTWKPWGKLQTNIEVGLIDQTQMDGLTDNGIYSGILSTTGETFVIICINNYAIAQQVGVQHISHLKYSLVAVTGEVKIEKRTRDAYGFWTEWENIGNGSTLPEATENTIGGVKLGISYNNDYVPLANINNRNGSGVGIAIDSKYFHYLDNYNLLKIHLNRSMLVDDGGNGIGVNLGTNANPQDVIPCVLGSDITDSNKYGINSLAVGIPYNSKQFCLKDNGLNLIDGIGSGVIKVTWDANSNMNDFKTPGAYEIYGERTVKTDNLPIANDGSGHSISARLTVVASTLQPANNEICVTQFLMLSNRVGGDGNVYVRTYNQNNGGVTDGVWSPWQKQMGLVETLINSNDTTVGQEIFTGTAVKIGDGLNGMIDNGMYSGIYTDNLNYTGTQSLYYLSAQPTFVETFVLVVVNDYAASGKLNLPRRITQLKYAVDAITGQSTVKKRVGTGSDNISWGDWEEIGGGSSEVDITDAVKTHGLPALVAQGFAKEGVIYKIKTFGDLPKLDINNKITLPKNGGSDSSILTEIVYKNNLFIVDIYTSIDSNGYYTGYRRYIMDSSCTYVMAEPELIVL